MNDTLELLTEIATPLGVALTAVGLLIGVRTYARQMNAQLFLDYTKRYEEIMLAFPDEGREARLRLDGEPPPPSRELSLAVLRYLNLCSEEFYLHERGFLSRKIWSIWREELERTLTTPLLRREWPVLRHEFSAYSKFCEYVDGVQRQAST